MLTQNYPRTYRPHKTNRQFMHGFGIFLVALFFGVTPLHLLGLFRHSMHPLQIVATDILVVAFAIWTSWSVERRVILYEDGIRVASWTSSRRLVREEIRGRRMEKLAWQAGGGSYYIIVPMDPHTRELKLPPFLDVDERFHAWMKEIPRLD